MTAEAARYILKMGFRERDHKRMRQLSAKAQRGGLSDEERSELEEYIRVGHMLALIQSKARRCLKRHGQVP
jgi:hypothetical protein